MAAEAARAPSCREVRRRIDALDRRIAALLVARLRLLDGFKAFKPRVRDRGREGVVLRRVSGHRRPRDAAFLLAVYREVIRGSVAYQRRARRAG